MILWRSQDLLTCKIAPPSWMPPKRRGRKPKQKVPCGYNDGTLDVVHSPIADKHFLFWVVGFPWFNADFDLLIQCIQTLKQSI
ncbi:MAG: hypothetical protein JWL77_1794 [Chthonomonadaceae bacterium]|nr:hypothetical protein [Chthonomonadaceae bacterium]